MNIGYFERDARSEDVIVVLNRDGAAVPSAAARYQSHGRLIGAFQGDPDGH
jgi:hypothetical protein